MIGDVIKQLRTEKGLSQIELAKICQVSRVTISLWENNQVVPSEKNLVRIANYFKIDFHTLVVEQRVNEQKRFKSWKIIAIGLLIMLLLVLYSFEFEEEKQRLYAFESGIRPNYVFITNDPRFELMNLVVRDNEDHYVVCLKIKSDLKLSIIETDMIRTDKINAGDVTYFVIDFIVKEDLKTTEIYFKSEEQTYIWISFMNDFIEGENKDEV